DAGVEAALALVDVDGDAVGPGGRLVRPVVERRRGMVVAQVVKAGAVRQAARHLQHLEVVAGLLVDVEDVAVAVGDLHAVAAQPAPPLFVEGVGVRVRRPLAGQVAGIPHAAAEAPVGARGTAGAVPGARVDDPRLWPNSCSAVLSILPLSVVSPKAVL